MVASGLSPRCRCAWRWLPVARVCADGSVVDGSGRVSPRCRCAWRWLPSMSRSGAGGRGGRCQPQVSLRMASSVARCARTGRGGVWSQPQVSLRMAVAPFDVAVGCRGGRGGRCQPQVSLRMAVAPFVSRSGAGGRCGGVSPRCRCAWRGSLRLQWRCPVSGFLRSAPGVVAHGVASFLWRPIVRRDAGSLTRTYRCAWCASFGIRRQIARLGRGQPRRRCHDRPLSVAVIARGVISAEAAMDITRKSLMSEISCTG